MKIEIRRNKHFQSDDWNTQKNSRQRDLLRISPKDTPIIEVLQSNPPKYRINGKIVSVPEEMTPEKYYERYMKRNFYQDNEKEKYWVSQEDKEQSSSDLMKDNTALHPLHKQYLESRLKNIAYQERRQARQDDFTTRMYGKKDYTEERNNIIRELNRDSERQFVSEQKEETSAPSKPEFNPAAPDESSDFDRRKELWENQKRWDAFQKSKHKGQSVENSKDPNAFERLGIPDPKNPQESISEADRNRRDFYKFLQPNG